jgi:hypothetical protein
MKINATVKNTLQGEKNIIFCGLMHGYADNELLPADRTRAMQGHCPAWTNKRKDNDRLPADKAVGRI